MHRTWLYYRRWLCRRWGWLCWRCVWLCRHRGSVLVAVKVSELVHNVVSLWGWTYIFVAKESHALWSVMMLIDNQEHIEAVVNPGSQNIAMSDAVSHDLGISYDLTIQLNMQSANGIVDWSLGLARNIPCQLGDITLYLQIHIICNPAYNILLERPLDVLTSSMVRNFPNEDQTITICNLNSGKISTIPTLPWGKARFWAQQNAAKAPAANFHILLRNWSQIKEKVHLSSNMTLSYFYFLCSSSSYSFRLPAITSLHSILSLFYS